MPILYSNSASLGSLDVTGSSRISSSIGRSLTVIGANSSFMVVSGTSGPALDISDFNAGDPTLLAFSSASVDILKIYNNKSVHISGSLIVTGSIAGSGGSGLGFPYAGTAIVTGSLIISSGSGVFSPLTASETLAAGDFVNITSGGVRKASNDNTAKQVHAFVTASYSATNPVVVYYGGLNTFKSSLVPGSRYFLGTSGGVTATPPTAFGQISQEIGVAISDTAILVNIGPAIIT